MRDQPTTFSKSDGVTALEFSPPEQCYESVAFYTNPKGQRFVVQVNGPDAESITQFTKELQVEFEVLADAPLDLPQEKGYKDSISSVNEQPLAEPGSGLAILIGVLQAEGIEPPYLFRLHLDPSIKLGSPPHRYRFTDTIEAKVTIEAQGGQVEADLLQDSNTNPVDATRVGLGGGLKIDTLVKPAAADQSTRFTVKIAALRAGSRYSLNVDVRKGAYDTYP